MIGIDSIELTIETKQNLIVKQREVFSKRTGARIAEIKPSTKKQKQGYRLSLCLPKMINTNNIRPFGVLDACCLKQMIEEITDELKKIFDVSLEKAFVSTVEVNATAELKNPENIECIMNLLALMFLQMGEKVYLTAHGKTNEKYKDVPLSYNLLRKTQQIESLKTPRLGNKRFSWKFYDKGLEQKIQNKGILRLEQIHTSRSLKLIDVPTQLNMFLESKNIYKLIKLYQSDFKSFFLDNYWKKGEDCFTQCCVNTILFELQEETPLSTVKILRELVEIDFEFFERACYAFYRNRKTATQTIRRVRQSNKVKINKGAVRELVQVFRAILIEY